MFKEGAEWRHLSAWDDVGSWLLEDEAGSKWSLRERLLVEGLVKRNDSGPLPESRETRLPRGSVPTISMAKTNMSGCWWSCYRGGG